MVLRLRPRSRWRSRRCCCSGSCAGGSDCTCWRSASADLKPIGQQARHIAPASSEPAEWTIGAPRPPYLRPQNATIVVSAYERKYPADSDLHVKHSCLVRSDAPAGTAVYSLEPKI